MDTRAAVLHDAGADPQLTDVEIRPPVGDEVLVTDSTSTPSPTRGPQQRRGGQSNPSW